MASQVGGLSHLSIKEAQLSDPKPRAYSFGRFSLDLARACLYCDKQEVKLRPKSFQLLVYLVEHPGRLITKQELMQALWPDSFVTDDSIVQCVKQIRQALQDASQHHIKTVPRSGYIFDLPVTVNEGSNGSKKDLQAEERADTLAAAETIEDGLPQSASLGDGQLTRGRRHLWLVAAFVCFAVVFGFVSFYASSNNAPTVWRGVPLTSYPGIERHPALSPDGSTVAFSWNGEKEDNFDIYTLRIGDSGPPRRLTTDAAPDSSPAWSPDGLTVSFLRSEGARNQLVIVPAAGGSERTLAEVDDQNPGSSYERQTWSPNGRWIALAARESPGLPRGLWLISSVNGEKRTVTQPPANVDDAKPEFSPDGQALVFVRWSKDGRVLYVQALSKDYIPSGKPQPLTQVGSADTAVWTEDGRRILYTSGSETRMISLATGVSQLVITEDKRVSQLSLGRHLVYTTTIDDDADIYYADIPSPGSPPASPRRLISSTREDQHPAFSPDGKRIAFVSERSGKRELWIANADGSNPVQRTSQIAVWFPSWSPNGDQIVFHGRPDGQAFADLFTVPATGGAMTRLTSDPAEDSLPSYSKDGQWIYFTSTRSGQMEIWKMPATGGDASRLTFGGGMMPVESPDGLTLFYADAAPTQGIWKIPIQGGEAVQVTAGPVGTGPAFAVGQHGLYYRSKSSTIQFMEFSTGISRPVVVADRSIVMRLSLSGDGKSLLFVLRTRPGPGSDLMLIKDFNM